ncbi:MAG: GNAT family protein [Sphingomonas sp.]
MFARTHRLTLRPYWPEDAAQLTAAIAHEEVAIRLARLPWPYGAEDAAVFVSARRAIDTPVFAVLSHESDYPRIVGGIGFHRDGDDYMLGYWLTPSVWGRGYATEAAAAVIAVAQHALGLKRVHAAHFTDNPASGRVLRKLGFREVERRFRPGLVRNEDVAAVEMVLDLDEPVRMPLAAAA